MAQQVTIRNKRTGETKTVPVEQLSQYGVSSPMFQTPQPSPANGVSGTPSTVGMMAGGVLGSPLGPLGRIGGAALGAGVGEEIAQRQAGQPGDPGAFLPALGPIGMMSRFAQKGKSQEKSPTEKAMAKGVASQLTGETIAGLFHLIKPGVIEGGFNKLTEYFSKKAGGQIPTQTVIDRFYNESLPKAVSKFGVEKAGEVAPKVIGMAEIPRPETPLSAQEMNYVRKIFNSLSKGLTDPVRHILEGDLARILREEQIKLARATGMTIPLQRLFQQTPELIGKIPFIGELLKSGMNLVGGGVSTIGKGLSRYALPTFLKTASEQR